MVEDRLAEEMLDGKISEGDNLEIILKNEKAVFRKKQ